MHRRRRDWNSAPYVAADGVVTQATGSEGGANDPSSLYRTERDTSTTTPSLAGSSTQSESKISHFPIPQVQGVVPGRRRAWQLSASASSPRLDSHSRLHLQTTRVSVPMLQTLENRQLFSASSPEPFTSSTIHPPSSPVLTSRYPRISPPVFLYPSAIVPQHLSNSPSHSHRTAPANSIRRHTASVGGAFDTPATTTMTTTTSPPSVMNQVDYQLAYLPDWYKILLIGTLAMLTLMVMCACLVFCINFPLKTWRMFGEGGGDDDDDDDEGKYGRKKKDVENDKRPFDKPSKYASRHGSGVVQIPSLQRDRDSRREEAVTSSAKYTAFSHPIKGGGNAYEEIGEGGIELRQRPPHRRYPHRWTGGKGAYTSQRRTSFPQGTQVQLSPSPRPSNSTSSSPLNPFLDIPPVPQQPPATGHAESQELGSEKRVQRSEAEYKKAYAAFFSTYPYTHSHSHPSPTSSPSPPANPASPSPAYTLNVSSPHDLEAGRAPVSHSHSDFIPDAREDGDDIVGMRSIVKKSVDWFDTGLDYMDGAVDGFIARVARWTDDDGEKAALLPMVRGGGVVERAGA